MGLFRFNKACYDKSVMQFNIITIFPHIFNSYFSESILARSQKNNLVGVKIHNLRDYTADKHKKVDDTPYGGGAGMVLKFEPIYEAVKSIKSLKLIKSLKSKEKTRVILFSAKGKKYSQKDAGRLAKYDNIILICGRYEGVDERVAKYIADEEISVGDYILTGGEIPAMVIIDSVSRLIPGVLGNVESAKNESHSIDGRLEHPQYTKPEIFSAKGGVKWRVPRVLLSGNHQNIERWRIKNSKSQNK